MREMVEQALLGGRDGRIKARMELAPEKREKAVGAKAGGEEEPPAGLAAAGAAENRPDAAAKLDEAVARGLDYLARQQNADGSFAAGKNPDGTPNKYNKPLKDFPRTGYVGLQDHHHDVWFKNIKVKPLK